MQSPKANIAVAEALVGMWKVTLTAFVVSVLYFARVLLVPPDAQPLVVPLQRFLVVSHAKIVDILRDCISTRHFLLSAEVLNSLQLATPCRLRAILNHRTIPLSHV